jgi:DNA repair/transcription protein MET18/MMS19
MLPILLFSLNNNTADQQRQQSQTTDDDRIYLSSLKSFEILLHESLSNENAYLLAYTQEIVERLLTMCRYERSMEIRLLALKCLNNLAVHLEPNKIVKFQREVCKRLESCLNDRKRLCRRQAVETRNRWFLLTTKNID